MWISVETGSGHPGQPGHIFGPGHPGLTRFTNYPGLTRIGSREKRNCSFDDVETSKRYRVALSCATPTYLVYQTYAQPRPFISKCSM